MKTQWKSSVLLDLFFSADSPVDLLVRRNKLETRVYRTVLWLQGHEVLGCLRFRSPLSRWAGSWFPRALLPQEEESAAARTSCGDITRRTGAAATNLVLRAEPHQARQSVILWSHICHLPGQTPLLLHARSPPRCEECCLVAAQPESPECGPEEVQITKSSDVTEFQTVFKAKIA